MRHRKKTVVLGREKAPRQALLRNLATSVILFERVQTTQAKAKAVQPIVDSIITLGKRPRTRQTLQALQALLFTDGAVRKVIEELAPRYASRRGGYTRISRLGRRQGDAAMIVQIEFV